MSGEAWGSTNWREPRKSDLWAIWTSAKDGSRHSMTFLGGGYYRVPFRIDIIQHWDKPSQFSRCAQMNS